MERIHSIGSWGRTTQIREEFLAALNYFFCELCGSIRANMSKSYYICSASDMDALMTQISNALLDEIRNQFDQVDTCPEGFVRINHLARQRAEY